MSQALKKGKRYTLKDYLGWPDEERWEIFEKEKEETASSHSDS